MFSQSIRAFARPFVAAFACAAVLLPASVRAEETGPVSCPVLGTKIDAVTKDNQSSDYKGVRYYFCCNGCKPQFDKDQTKFLKDAKNKDKVLGISLFDPVTTKRLTPEKATTHSDFGGVRYFFAKEDDKKTFDKEPKKFTTAPKKDVLFCPVSNELVASPTEASDYSDYQGARYYFCCAGCKPQFDKSPDKYLDGLDARIKAAQDKQAAAGKNPGK
jgi:YHS domain-containing protein